MAKMTRTDPNRDVKIQSPKPATLSEHFDNAFGTNLGKTTKGRKITTRPGSLYGGMPGNSGPK